MLKKENNQLTFEYLISWYQRKTLEIEGLNIGRRYDHFSMKSGKDKSTRYRLMLKYFKNQNQKIMSILFGSLDIITGILYFCGIGLKSKYPKFAVCSLVIFSLSLFLTILFNILYSKKWDQFNNKLFPKKELRIDFSTIFLQVKKEADKNKFYELHEALEEHLKKKITKTGGVYENGTIDLCFQTKEHEFFITFYNHFVTIQIDEESRDLKIELSYDNFKDYEELESKIYMIMIENL